MNTQLTAAEIQAWCKNNQACVHINQHGEIRAGHESELGHRRTLGELASMVGISFAHQEGFAVTLDVDGYYSLADVLGRAFEQASGGKGKERHATSLPFDQQPMQALADLYGVGFLLGQAAKKAQESQRLPAGRDVAELLGAIVYTAGAVIALERRRAKVANDNQVQAVAKHG